MAAMLANEPIYNSVCLPVPSGWLPACACARVRAGDRHLMISCDKVLMEDLCATMGDVFLGSPLDPTTTAEVDPHPDMDDDLKEYYRQVKFSWKYIEILQCHLFALIRQDCS